MGRFICGPSWFNWLAGRAVFSALNKISKLYFCGLDLDACILASAFEAFDLGFDFEILYDFSDSSAKIDIDDSTKKIIKRNF